MNATEIRETAAALPALPIVFAIDMLRSQAYRPTAQERKAIQARREFFRVVGMPTNVRVEVRDVYAPSTVIGHLEF